MYKIPERPEISRGHEVDEENISDEMFEKVITCAFDLEGCEKIRCSECPIVHGIGCQHWAVYLMLKRLNEQSEIAWNEGFAHGYKTGLEDKENPL